MGKINKDAIIVEISYIKGLMNSISPKLETWSKLKKRREELEKLLLEIKQNV